MTTFDPIGLYEREIAETIAVVDERERRRRAERERQVLMRSYFDQSIPPWLRALYMDWDADDWDDDTQRWGA